MNEAEMTDQSSTIKPKEKPRICAIDLEPEIVEALESKGLHCFSSTLGYQVRVPNSYHESQHQCLVNFYFPSNLHEYDIIIVDLKNQEPIEYIESDHTYSSFEGEVGLRLSHSVFKTSELWLEDAMNDE